MLSVDCAEAEGGAYLLQNSSGERDGGGCGGAGAAGRDSRGGDSGVPYLVPEGAGWLDTGLPLLAMGDAALGLCMSLGGSLSEGLRYTRGGGNHPLGTAA